MSRHISNHLRLLVAARARYRCEYCRVPELFLATTFHIDHIRSLKHGGQTTFLNLAFCCPHCNHNKGSDVAAFEDDGDEKTVRFFNPRRDSWAEHFDITEGEILGKTKIGEATARIFEFNLPERVLLRAELLASGHFLID